MRKVIVIFVFFGFIFLGTGNVACFWMKEKVDFQKIKTSEGGVSSCDASFERGGKVITNNSDWLELWEKIERDSSRSSLQKEPLPNIDFDKEMVIAVFMGKTFTHGGGTGVYTIKIDRIEETEKDLEVHVKEKIPAASDFGSATSACTSPFSVIKLKKSTKEVKFFM